MTEYRTLNNYKVTRKLGSGAFGDIYLGINPKTNQEVAIKIEDENSRQPQLFYEAKIYKLLLKDSHSLDKGIPQVYSCTIDGKYNVMVMDLLGQSLEDLFNTCNRSFSLKTVLMLGKQMLSRTEFVHSKGILHRDIKADNFVTGSGRKQHKIYMIDFGLAKRYNGDDGKHIPQKEGKGLTGTARYASINAHLGLEQGRRDDLESLGYVMLYLLKGKLPWQGIKTENKKEKNELIMKKKMETSIEVLCEGAPIEFVRYMEYCKNLKFEEKPDYSYLEKLLLDLFGKSGYKWDYEYDWTVLAKKKKEEQKNEPERDNNKTEKNLRSSQQAQLSKTQTTFTTFHVEAQKKGDKAL